MHIAASLNNKHYCRVGENTIYKKRSIIATTPQGFVVFFCIVLTWNSYSQHKASLFIYIHQCKSKLFTEKAGKKNTQGKIKGKFELDVKE